MFWLVFFACNEPHSYDENDLLRLRNEDSFRQEFLAQLPELDRDILLLKLAVQNPSMAPKFCREVLGRGAKEKCKQVIGRPHLQLTKPQVVDGQ